MQTKQTKTHTYEKTNKRAITSNSKQTHAKPNNTKYIEQTPKTTKEEQTHTNDK